MTITTIACRSQSGKLFKNVPESDVMSEPGERRDDFEDLPFGSSVLEKERVALLPLTILRLLSKRRHAELGRGRQEKQEAQLDACWWRDSRSRE